MVDNPIYVDEERESWINLMYCREAAKTDPELRKIFVDRLPPEVLRAADECTDYEDFKRRIELYNAENEDERSRS